MRLKASLLGTASGMTLVLIAVGLLHSTSKQGIEADSTDALALVVPLLPLLPSTSSTNATTTPAATIPDGVEVLLDRPSHSDTKTSETLKRRFSVDNSLDRVKQIDRLLATIHTPTVHTADKAAAIDSLALEAQIRAHRWVGSVTGTLKKQDYEIKKLELALAQKQFKDGEIPQAALVQKQASYQKSAREFKTFLNSFKMAD
jgi:hypothetical protein